MSVYKFNNCINLYFLDKKDKKCYQYAVDETVRLFDKIGIQTTKCLSVATDVPFVLGLGEALAPVESLPKDLKWDGYLLNVTSDGVTICANSAKGILNGVYDLAERLGFTFLLPGEDGEWCPDNISSLKIGKSIMNPRFPYRGVFWSKLNCDDYTETEWLEFYAKLRFNALRLTNLDSNELIEKLGLRIEVGGHGLSGFLPRDMFDKQPKLFRMFQPEDFGGKRLNDSNLCVSNLKTRKIVKDNFKKVIDQNKGAYAIHAWADDLPGGGWCLCPSCRAFSAKDQAMLAMRLLAEAVRESESKNKIPVLAYHDTMFPGTQIKAVKESFLLFAPRERCYGHALDAPDCEQNKYYMQSLKEWMLKFSGIDDAHTFEYYFDQILFRGMYPFLPTVIAQDMTVYQQAGIETHMSLQVAGPTIAPEYNMLIFSALHWDENLSASDFCQNISVKLSGKENSALLIYLKKRGEIFEKAMRFCGHDPEVYMDYRWLPETTSEFGKEIAQTYLRSSEALTAAAVELEKSLEQLDSKRLENLISSDVKRAKFEATELKSMHYQQLAMNSIAKVLNSETVVSPVEGCKFLKKAIKALEVSKEKAHDYNLPENAWYFRNINNWLIKEFKEKIENYSGK